MHRDLSYRSKHGKLSHLHSCRYWKAGHIPVQSQDLKRYPLRKRCKNKSNEVFDKRSQKCPVAHQPLKFKMHKVLVRGDQEATALMTDQTGKLYCAKQIRPDALLFEQEIDGLSTYGQYKEVTRSDDAVVMSLPGVLLSNWLPDDINPLYQFLDLCHQNKIDPHVITSDNLITTNNGLTWGLVDFVMDKKQISKPDYLNLVIQSLHKEIKWSKLLTMKK